MFHLLYLFKFRRKTFEIVFSLKTFKFYKISFTFLTFVFSGKNFNIPTSCIANSYIVIDLQFIWSKFNTGLVESPNGAIIVAALNKAYNKHNIHF